MTKLDGFSTKLKKSKISSLSTKIKFFMIKKRKPKSKNYFTQETEDYIVLYNNSKDFEERSRIYERHIHYAFFKLTQNIIHTFINSIIQRLKS